MLMLKSKYFFLIFPWGLTVDLMFGRVAVYGRKPLRPR